MTRGRPRNNEPALAWDYHRAIDLVRVLASNAPMPGIRVYCESWGVELYEGDILQTVHALARHALEYSRRPTPEAQPEDD